MNQTLSVSLESPQHGFMSLRINGDRESFVTVVSHEPYDSLRDLIEALALVLESDREVTVKWNAEPDEYDFRLEARGDELCLAVIHYPDHRRLPDTSSTVFSFCGPRRDACVAFWVELRDLQGRTAQDEFDRQWRREFPEREMQRLTERVSHLK